MAHVLVVGLLDVQVHDAHAAQLLREVLVVACGFLGLVFRGVKRAPGAEVDRNLVETEH